MRRVFHCQEESRLVEKFYEDGCEQVGSKTLRDGRASLKCEGRGGGEGRGRGEERFKTARGEKEGEEGRGLQRVGGPKGGGPKFRVFPSLRPKFVLFLSFSLSGGLLVELWSRAAAMDHLNCAFGLLLGHFV